MVLLLPGEAHLEAPSSPHFLESTSSRRAQSATWEMEYGYLWGTCVDEWDNATTQCLLGDTHQCSSHLSEGPADADVEITLGGLPPSGGTAETEVHLQWWGTTRSEFDYHALDGPLGAGIFVNMHDAYPLYNSSEFNGGNVRVNENGEATIRVASMASYLVYQWIAFPHIHLRVCTGEHFVHYTPETVYFHWDGPILWAHCDAGDFTILSSRRYTPPPPRRFIGSFSFEMAGLSIFQVENATHASLSAVLGIPLAALTLEVVEDEGRRLQEEPTGWKISYVVEVSSEDAVAETLAAACKEHAPISEENLLPLLQRELVTAGANASMVASTIKIRSVGALVEVTTTSSSTRTTTRTSTSTLTLRSLGDY